MINAFTYKGYTASIDHSSSDNVFHGKIAGIDDLVSFEGTTEKELEQAFQEAVDDYIETCKDLGKEPQKPTA
jgi:predicted HicB family RNase H-like nuclease